jgi:hypothetical protein
LTRDNQDDFRLDGKNDHYGWDRVNEMVMQWPFEAKVGKELVGQCHTQNKILT